MKCPGQANPQRQIADRWLSGAGEGEGGAAANEYGFPFGEMETF